MGSCETTPYTELLAVYRSCPHGLTAGEEFGRRLLARPDELASLFLLSVAQFSRYVNIDEYFHDGAVAPAFSPQHGEMIGFGVDFAKRLADAKCCAVSGADAFTFHYVDRELDVMRTSTGRLLDDGTPSKRALVLDLLLRREDGTPILGELKIGKDKHAIYALVQVLAAAVHLVTPAQRTRLARCYGPELTPPKSPPYLELAVLLVDRPERGKATTIVNLAKEVSRALMEAPEVRSLIAAIHFLVPEDLDADCPRFREL